MLRGAQTAPLLGALSFLSISLSWRYPGTLSFTILAWISVIIFQYYIRHPKLNLLHYFIFALFAHGISFYWIPSAVSQMSGMGAIGTYAFSFSFITLGAAQFLCFALIFRCIPASFELLAIRSAIAWTSIEVLPIRIFPWIMGYTQSEFPLFIQIADIAGSITISFCMFWIAESAYLYTINRKLKYAVLSSAILALTCFYGYCRLNYLSKAESKSLNIALIQSGSEENIEDSQIRKLTKYKELTEEVSKQSDLVVWPENVLIQTVSESVINQKYDSTLPSFSHPPNLLVGTKTYRKPSKHFNSAMLIRKDGSIPVPYHKQILIPFGEYIPYENSLPWLRLVNPKVSKTDRGDRPVVFDIQKNESGDIVKISPLICYEDVIPSLSHDAVNAGAEVLIALSNDSWLPENRVLALYQHFALARFRAIETRRPFLRATTTGITAYVNVLGDVVSMLEPHIDASITNSISSYDRKSLYTAYIGDSPWWLAALFTFTAILSNIWRKLNLSKAKALLVRKK